jgi:hypothetical protein
LFQQIDGASMNDWHLNSFMLKRAQAAAARILWEMRQDFSHWHH